MQRRGGAVVMEFDGIADRKIEAHMIIFDFGFWESWNSFPSHSHLMTMPACLLQP